MTNPTSRESRQVQPETLRLAHGIPITALYSVESAVWAQETAAELRRLHEVNQELVEALESLVRNGQKQGWNDKYEWDMDKARAAIAKTKGESNE